MEMFFSMGLSTAAPAGFRTKERIENHKP